MDINYYFFFFQEQEQEIEEKEEHPLYISRCKNVSQIYKLDSFILRGKKNSVIPIREGKSAEKMKVEHQNR